MATIELELDDLTIERARQLVGARNLTLEDLLKDALERLQPGASNDDPFWGLFADCPEAVDERVAGAMEARTKTQWRVG